MATGDHPRFDLRVACRIVGIEYLQNFPVLLGLMLAIHTAALAGQVAWTALGSFATALCIAQTERIKLALPPDHRENPRDLPINALSFFLGCLLYVIYSGWRVNATYPLLIDGIVGVILGGIVGGLQMAFLDTRQLTRGGMIHMLALMLTAIVVLMLIGVLTTWTPLLGALLLCLIMTLIIVRFDYWQRILRLPS